MLNDRNMCRKRNVVSILSPIIIFHCYYDCCCYHCDYCYCYGGTSMTRPSITEPLLLQTYLITQRNPLFKAAVPKLSGLWTPCAVKFFHGASGTVAPCPILKIFRQKPILCQEAYS